MTTLALGAVGAGVGYYLTGTPQGAQIGFLVGSYLGGFLEEGPHSEGPRLNDRAIQASTYGIPIPIVRGTARVAGNIIWAEPLREVSKDDNVGGKGGPSATQTTYSYFGTFAISLCANEITAVRKIWADGKLIYDASDGNSGPLGIAPSEAFFQHINIDDVALPLVVYLGSETQTADPTMQAYLGAGNVPAYRGQAYVVFTDFPLERFGNRIPNLSFEVVESGAIADVVTQYATPTGMRLYACYVPLTNQVWLQMHQSSNSDPYLVRLNADTGAIEGYVYPQSATEHSTFNGNPIFDPAENVVYVSTNTSLSVGHFCVVDAVSGVEISCHVFSLGYLALKVKIDPDTGGLISELWSYRTSSPVLRLISKADGSTTRSVSVPWTTTGELVFDDVLGKGWIRLQITDTTQLWVLDEFGLTVSLAYTHSSSIDLFAYDSLRNVLWLATNSSATVVGFDVEAYALVALTITMARQPFYLFYDPQRDLLEGTNYNVSSGYWFANYVSTGAAYKDIHENHSSIVIMSGHNAVLLVGGGTSGITNHSLVKIRFDVVTDGSVLLSDVVEDICVRTKGLEAADVDVTALTDEVLGYVMTRQSSARACLQQLAVGFLFDGIESDDVIKFVKRGRSSAVTIATDDLAAHEAGGSVPDILTKTRAQDVELPTKLNVIYAARALDYAQGTQIAERLAGEAPTSGQMLSIEAPIVFADDYAKELADALMFTAWTERTSYQFATSLKYAEYEPTDVVTVVDKILRITRKHEAGGLLKFEGVADDSAVYSQGADGVAAILTAPAVSALVASYFTPIDSALLRDQDDASGFYAALGGYTAGWGGAVLYKSTDAGATYAQVRAFGSATTRGVATSALGDFHSGNIFDELNILTVALWADATLASSTTLAVLAGANAVALAAGDYWEILQFRTATLNADGTYSLTGLLRGRRGSEYAMSTHAAGDAFVLLDASTMANIAHASAEIGLSRLYKPVSIGDTLQTTAPQAFTSNAVRLEPLAPVHVGGGRNASLDVAINWIRRTRIGGEWRDGVDVPLGEDSELYDVEIYTTSGYVTVARTFADQTSANISYTAAQQTSDFGSTQATVYCKVYQKSTLAGRGFAATASI
jgi:Putative phage tail protein